MKPVTKDLIMRARFPWEIFSRHPDTMEAEKAEYLRMFTPHEYKKVENFLVQQKIILLYQKGLEELSSFTSGDDQTIIVTEKDGFEHHFHYLQFQEQKIGLFLTTNDSIVILVPPKYKKYYENYIKKSNFTRIIKKSLWEEIKYYLPHVTKTFETTDGDFVIIVKRPNSEVYPLTSILEYFDGRLEPHYVASIMTRLYKTVVYLDLCGISHNGISVENIWFSPGRFINPGEKISSAEDVRVVGLFGGWFFSTNNLNSVTGQANDKISALPAKIKQIVPQNILNYKYGSYKIDLLAIKQVGRELLGDISGKNLGDTPKPFIEWLTSDTIASNVGQEFEEWEIARNKSFGNPMFIEMKWR